MFLKHMLTQKPELAEQVDLLSQESWPQFLLHGNARFWSSLFNEFADFQILFCDPAGALIACGHTVPLTWSGQASDLPADLDGVLVRAMEGYTNGSPPNTLCALAAMVARHHRGQGLSSEIVRAMTGLAARQSLHALIAPVRPTLKSRYPLTPLEHYVGWTQPDGAPFDPWIRVHWRLGAVQLQVAPRALVVTGSVADWEQWTAMQFPESGSYVVPGALQPVVIDRDRDTGYYEDPNLWMKHAV